MDWPLAISRNRAALLAMVGAIVALLGGREAGAGGVARGLRNAALALLRPAESAARRLIVIAARGLVAAPRSATFRPFAPAKDIGGSAETGIDPGAAGQAAGLSRPPSFRLFDPAKRFAPFRRAVLPRGVPRIRSFWGAPAPLPPAAPPAPAPARPDPLAPVAIGRLRLRLGALERALADLPRQARRRARGRAKWAAARAAGRDADLRPHRPLRFGRPPGWRLRPSRDVDHLLRECHTLAMRILNEPALRPDTS